MRIRTHSSERNQSGHRMGVVVRGDHPSSSDPTRVDRRIVSRTRIMRLIKEIDQLERRHARTVQVGQRNRLWDDLQAKRHELEQEQQGETL